MKAIINIKTKPISKQHGTGRSGSRYFPKPEYLAFKELFSWESLAQLHAQGWRVVESGPVWMSVIIRANKNLGDLSNLIGGIEDALEGVAYKNDCQVMLKRIMGMKINGLSEPTVTIELDNQFKDNACVQWVEDGLKKRRKRKGVS